MLTTLFLVSALAGATAAADRSPAPLATWYLDDSLKQIPVGVVDDDLKALHARLSALIPEQQVRDSAESFGVKQARLQGEKLIGNKGFDDVYVTTIEQVALSYEAASERATLAVKFDDAAPADGTSTSGLIHVVDKVATDLGTPAGKGGKQQNALPARRKVLAQSIMFLSRSRTLWVRTDEHDRVIMTDLLVKKNAINELKGRVAAKLVFKVLPLPVREIDDTALPSADNPVEVHTRNAVAAAELMSVVFFDRKSGDVLALVK